MIVRLVIKLKDKFESKVNGSDWIKVKNEIINHENEIEDENEMKSNSYGGVTEGWRRQTNQDVQNVAEEDTEKEVLEKDKSERSLWKKKNLTMIKRGWKAESDVVYTKAKPDGSAKRLGDKLGLWLEDKGCNER